MPTEHARAALEILRDGSRFEWYVIPFLALVIYVYVVEIERRDWNTVLAGLALWGMDFLNEIANSVFFHVTGRAPIWGAPGKTAFLILIGLNIEICFMFAIAGVLFAKLLPEDRTVRILGLPNRWFLALGFSLFCVAVEIGLNSVDALTWDWPWWSARAPFLIVPFGYLHFFVVAFWVHDMAELRSKLAAVGTIFGLVAASVAVFGGVLGWL